MPTKAPPSGPQLKKILLEIGQQIRAQRKALKVSATATAEAANISRMTLNRIEKGEPSVTMGAYINVISVLGLGIQLMNPSLSESVARKTPLTKDSKIHLAEFPQLQKLGWQLNKASVLSPEEALNLYERNWRHLDLDKMIEVERDLLKALIKLFGKERLLV